MNNKRTTHLSLILPIVLSTSTFMTFAQSVNDKAFRNQVILHANQLDRAVLDVDFYMNSQQHEKAKKVIDNVINNQIISSYAKEKTLYQFINSIKTKSENSVTKSIIEKLSQYEAITRLPHHDSHARPGTLQFNIASAAKATLHHWQRDKYKKQYQQSIVNQPAKMIVLFSSANIEMTAKKQGALDAILSTNKADLIPLKRLLITHYQNNKNDLLNSVLLNTAITLSDVKLSSILLNYDDYYAQQLVSSITQYFDPEVSFSLLKLATNQVKLRSLAFSQMSNIEGNEKISTYLSLQQENINTRSAASFALKKKYSLDRKTQKHSPSQSLKSSQPLSTNNDEYDDAFIQTITEDDDSGDNIALGYEVPMPKESLTPIDGFRTYQSLKSYHQGIAENNDYVTANNIGTTLNNEIIWSYSLSDDNNTTSEGMITEPAVLIDGGIHAREWQTPEVVSATLERLANNSQDKGLNQYLLDNLNIIVIPVVNVDGFIQTQKYPNQVMSYDIETGDPDYPFYTVFVDGRMRRKNMLDTDDLLSTFSDNEYGVDLNRNFGPSWGISDEASSPEERSSAYRGSAAYSEKESQAILAAAELGPADKLRYYTNTHSYTSYYFVPNTGNERRDVISENLANLMIESTYAQADSPRRYYNINDDGYDKAGFVAEHFAETYQIPSYILEVEPYNGNEDYNGTGFFGGGFILPDTEIHALREKTTNTTLLGFYHQAGPAIVESVEIYDVDKNEKIFSGNWTTNSPTQRFWESNQVSALSADTAYRLKVSLNKPMRYRNTNAEISNHPGVEVGLFPTITISPSTGESFSLKTDSGKWLNSEETDSELGYKRYQDDSYMIEFSLPSSVGSTQEQQINIQFDIQDFAGMNIDANPETVVDWENGAWSNYEDSNGELGDDGGIDKTISLKLAATKPIEIITIEPKKKSSGGGIFSCLLLLMLSNIIFLKRRKLS